MSETSPTGPTPPAEYPPTSDETLHLLTAIVDRLAPAVYQEYAEAHGLEPAEVPRRKECEGVSDALHDALAAQRLHTHVREFQGAAPDDRHYHLAWHDVAIDGTYQQFVEGRAEGEMTQLPPVLVCRYADLRDTLTSYGVPAHKLNHWLDARDRPTSIQL